MTVNGKEHIIPVTNHILKITFLKYQVIAKQFLQYRALFLTPVTHNELMVTNANVARSDGTYW